LTKPVAAALIARGPALTRLRRGRLTDDLFVAPLLQHTALDVLTAPGWPRHLAGLRKALRLRRDALTAALISNLPECTLHLKPADGGHLWLRLPDRTNDTAITSAAHRHGVTVSPGHAYFPAEAPGPYLRFSYAAADLDALHRAAALLAQAMSA